MSSLLKVELVYTGGLDSISKYIDFPELSFVDSLVGSDCDVPVIRVQDSDICKIVSRIDGIEDSALEFDSKSDLVNYIQSGSYTKYSKVPDLNDIIGLYSETDTVDVFCTDCGEVEITIVSNAACKDYKVSSDVDMCILVDTRNPELKLNTSVIQRVLSDVTCKCVLYSNFDSKDIKELLPEHDIDIEKI